MSRSSVSGSIAEFPGVEHGFLTESARGRAWARNLLLTKLESLPIGRLRWQEGDETLVLGGRGSGPDVGVRIHDPRVYPKILFGGAVGAAEAYMAGLWTTDDLTETLRLFLRNRQVLTHLDSGFGRMARPVRQALHWLRANSRAGSRRNIAAHYDLSNELFELFLDPWMMYSSAIFESDDQDLDAAAVAKMDRLCRKLELSPGDHLLEIGTGWGGFAVYAAETYGCRVTTTTLSQEQLDLARRRVRRHGLEDRVELLLSDYRDLEGQYDKLVSIEMVEAVGHAHLGEYLRVCSERLRPGGLFALQGITIADRLFEPYRHSVDFIQRYIFPGSALISVGSFTEALRRSSDLQLVHLEDIGPHYARTLREWRRRFFANLPAVKDLGFSDRFVRMWEYYLCYCEAGFLERTIGNLQVVAAKPQNRSRPILGRLEPRAEDLA